MVNLNAVELFPLAQAFNDALQILKNDRRVNSIKTMRAFKSTLV
jgi:hypothetical protein